MSSEPLKTETPIIFVNSVAVHGSLNGVVNMLLSTAQFLPDGTGEVKIEPRMAVDLRFDLYCAQQIHDAIGKILEDQTKPAPKAN